MDLIRVCTASLVSLSPYSQSAGHLTPKAHAKETADEYEVRTWREKATVNADGIVSIPGFGLKQCLDAAAKRLSMKIPGKRNATYTKHFAGGILLPDLVPLGMTKEELEGQTLFVNSDGIRGSGKRVWRTFPLIKSWSADVAFHVIDAEITRDVFERHLREAGMFVGIGRFRPEKGGTNGRFKVAATQWADVPIEEMLAA